VPPPAEPVPPPTAWSLAREARALLKAKETERALARMKEALALGDKDGLAADERGLLLYQYALMLERAGDSGAALRSLREAAKLAPGDADIQLELALQLLADDQFGAAEQAADAALRLGLAEADEKKEAARIKAQARLGLLHERLTLYGGISFAFDSNVLQSARSETIAGINPSAPLRQQLSRAELQKLRTELGTAEGFRQAIPPQQELDLPLTLSLNLGGRLAGNKVAELWLGYSFSQLLMFSPERSTVTLSDGSTSVVKDHDSYSLQEHAANLNLFISPAPWLSLRPRFEGFANFAGLSSFAPFQGGFNAALDALFIESSRLRTRLLYQHQLRRSFDRVNDRELDADRDEVRLSQELRLRGESVRVRGVLGYRFRSERSGRLELFLPGEPVGAECSMPPRVSTGEMPFVCYRSTLSYQGHEASLRARISLPHGVELVPTVSYEYRTYPEPYRHFRSPLLASSTEIYSVRRSDHLVNAGLAVEKELPRGFSLELGYAFTSNSSSIANALDNRSYTKHVAQLTAGYSF
jgi:hypothetical protein